jgi:uncharacterized SAM-binding protein YcdF (DUF218 family)
VLFLFGCRPVSDLLVRSLEHRYPPPPGGLHADAIVVLGGDARWLPVTHEATVLGTRSLDRLVVGIELWKAGAAPKLLLAGGTGDPFSRGPAEGEAMRAQAMALGVPADAILVDAKSRTTAENALEAKALLGDASRIILVTSALHLPRSVALFTRAGFSVQPAPADYLATGEGFAILDLLPRAIWLAHSDDAIHEWVGLATYRIAGRL